MKLVIRHGLSEANNRNNIGTPAFASADAPLMDEGTAAAQELGRKLYHTHAVELSQHPIATSEYLRTIQTALAAGALQSNLRQYAILNELDSRQNGTELRRMLDAGIIPQEAVERAEMILASPPDEAIWVTHGLVIAGLCHVLGIYGNRRLIPHFCEIRQLPL